MYAAVWNISKNMLIIDLNDLTLCTVLTAVCKLLVDAINITCNVQRRETNLQRFLQFSKCMPVISAESSLRLLLVLIKMKVSLYELLEIFEYNFSLY